MVDGISGLRERKVWVVANKAAPTHTHTHTHARTPHTPPQPKRAIPSPLPRSDPIFTPEADHSIEHDTSFNPFYIPPIHPISSIFFLFSESYCIIYTLAQSTSFPDLSWSHHYHHTILNPPPSPPPAEYDPDEIFTWQQQQLSENGGISITQDLPLSPLASPSSDQTTFLPPTETTPPTMIERSSPTTHPLNYAPFRSSPLANLSARATIRRISETGEMELEDTEEMDTDRVSIMEDISGPIADETHETLNTFPSTAGLPVLGAEGLFRAGTPTPVITPPFPQITIPPTMHENTNTASHVAIANAFQELEGSGMEAFEALPLMMSDNIFDGVIEEELNPIEDYVEMTHEMSTEELDTECIDLLSTVADNSLGRTTS